MKSILLKTKRVFYITLIIITIIILGLFFVETIMHPILLNETKEIIMLCVIFAFSLFVNAELVNMKILMDEDLIIKKLELHKKIKILESKRLINQFSSFYSNFNSWYIDYLNGNMIESFKGDISLFISLTAALISISSLFYNINFSTINTRLYLLLTIGIPFIVIFNIILHFVLRKKMLNKSMDDYDFVINQINTFNTEYKKAGN